VIPYDFNHLEQGARKLFDDGRPDEALKIYMSMADGDASLDGGYLGIRIAECYRALGRLHEAKYWYVRAIEENPVVNAPCTDEILALGEITIDHLL
jgi:tetratricopeptide (TPR) repeat protein